MSATTHTHPTPEASRPASQVSDPLLGPGDSVSRMGSQGSDRSIGSSYVEVRTTTDMTESHPRYVPPRRRGVAKEMGDEVVVAAKEGLDQDGLVKTQGVEHRHHEKLLVRVPYALTKEHINVLSKYWPGFYFASTGPGNHDHPIAHANTMVATRMMQRMFPAGSKILDVYGNPRSCESFNWSQQKSNNPKSMRALVNRFAPADFIREVNKWGPPTVDGISRYDSGQLYDMPLDYFRDFDQYQLVHTLYYIEMDTMCSALHIDGGPRRALALVHRHEGDHGFLNNGEQEYWVRGGVVKQTNVPSKTTYYHRDITADYFVERKEWWDPEHPDRGMAWECHYQSPGTWVIEIVAARRSDIHDKFPVDWEAKFKAAEAALNINTVPSAPPPVTDLPLPDGRVIHLEVENKTLMSALHRRAVGKSRVGAEGRQLFKDLVQTAVHLVHPGALFPGQDPLPVPANRLIDYVVSAWVGGIAHEMQLADAVSVMQPVLVEHASVLKSGMSSTTRLEQVLDAFRVTIPLLERLLPGSGSTLRTLDSALREAF